MQNSGAGLRDVSVFPDDSIFCRAVKMLLYFPLAYLAGMDGFAWFAPYLAVVVVIVSLFSRPRVPAD